MRLSSAMLVSAEIHAAKMQDDDRTIQRRPKACASQAKLEMVKIKGGTALPEDSSQ